MTSTQSPNRPQFSWRACWNTIAMKVGHPVVITGLTLSVAIAGGRYWGLMQGMELAAYDHLIRQQPDQGEDNRLLVIGIDESDLQLLQEWPISDYTLFQTLQRIEQYNARAIGVDILRDIPFEPGRAELLQYLQQTNETVIMACKASATDGPGTPPPPGVKPDLIGFADLIIDPGGILRRSLLLLKPLSESTTSGIKHYCNDESSNLVSISLQMAVRYLQKDGISTTFTETGELWIGDTHIRQFQPHTGGYARSDSAGYQVLLDYRSEENAVPQVSLTDVLNHSIDPELVRDRLVFIGYTTPQAKDNFYTPYSGGRRDDQKMAGVVVHAQATSQILQAVLNEKSMIWAWPDPLEIVWIFAWSFVGGAIARWLRRPLTFSLGCAIAAGTIYGVCFVAFLEGLWLPLVPAVFASLGASIGVILLERFSTTVYGKTVVRQFKQFLKIEIDEDKLQKQVAEITETDYFQNLQNTVKTLRNQNKDQSQLHTLPLPKTDKSAETFFSLDFSQNKEDFDSLHHSHQKDERSQKHHSDHKTILSHDAIELDNSQNQEQFADDDSDDAEDDYFTQLQQDINRLKNQ